MFPIDKYRQKKKRLFDIWFTGGSYHDVSSRLCRGQVVFLWWQHQTGCVAAVLLAGAACAHPADDSSLWAAQNITLCPAAFLFLLRWCVWVSHGVGVSFTNRPFPTKERWLPALLCPGVQHSKRCLFFLDLSWMPLDEDVLLKSKTTKHIKHLRKHIFQSLTGWGFFM